jgi:hypothetical protein
LSDVRSDIMTKISGVEVKGSNEKVMRDLVRVIDDELGKSGSALYDAARKTTQDKNTLFGKTVSKNLRNTEDGPSAFMETFTLGGDKGKVAAQKLKASGDVNALNSVEDYFKGLVKGETVDAKLINKYRGFLDEFPELRDKYSRLAQANKRTEGATGLQKASKAALTKQEQAMEATKIGLEKTRKQARTQTAAVKEGLVGQYAEDSAGTIKKLLGSDNKAGDLKRLANSLANKGAGGSFKGEVRDTVKKLLSDANSIDEVAKGSAITTLTNMKKSLVDGGVITEKEFAGMLNATKRSALSKTLRKAKGSVDEGKHTDNEVSNVVASGMSIMLLGGLNGSQQLAMTNAVRRTIMKVLRKDYFDPKAVARVDEYLADPAKWLAESVSPAERAMLAKVKDEKKAARLISKLITTGSITDTITED